MKDTSKWIIDGFLIKEPKPIWRKGMTSKLIIIAYNFMDIFIEENEKYRTSIIKEYCKLKKEISNLESIRVSTKSPFALL